MVMVSGGPASHLSQHSILCGPSKRRFIVRQPNIPPASPHQPSKGEIHLAKQTQPLVGHVEEWKHGCWYHATSIFGETMADLLGKLQELSDPEPFLPTPTNGLPTRPFWSGTLAYDLVQWTQPLALQHPPKEGEILAVLWLIERFAAERKSDGDITAFACDGDDWAALANSVQTKPYEGVNSHENPHQETSNLTDQEHQQGIEAIREGIAAGEFYQVNLGRWWEGQLSRHPRTIFEELCTTNPAPFSAYLCAEDLELALVSSSPESLLQSDGDIVRTAPIKGTRPRGSTKEAEVLLRNEMLNDEKERAEHRMLVDLMRNDLGAVSELEAFESNGSMSKHTPMFSTLSHKWLERYPRDKLRSMHSKRCSLVEASQGAHEPSCVLQSTNWNNDLVRSGLVPLVGLTFIQAPALGTSSFGR